MVYVREYVHLLHLKNIFTTSLLLLLMSSLANAVLIPAPLLDLHMQSYMIYSWCYTPSLR